MLAELVDHVIGVDPDRDSITVAVVDAHTTGVVATARFGANTGGYRDTLEWVAAQTAAGERAWAIEGTASYGRGLTQVLVRVDEWVIEFDHPKSAAANDGAKTDELDAIRAAREVLGRSKLAQPRAVDGHREAIRVHAVTRAGAVRARTAAINELKALLVTAPDELREQLRRLSTPHLVERCGRFRDSDRRGVADRHTWLAMRALARRISHLDDEITDHDRALKALLAEAAPQLLAEHGIGHVTAAEFYLAWSHRGRCRNEAAYARLGGVAPVDTNSGQRQNRHRLNRRGDRQLNRALYLVAVTRRRSCDRTQAYIARRVSEGKTEREAIRCIKRYIARRVWRLLEHPAPAP